MHPILGSSSCAFSAVLILTHFDSSASDVTHIVMSPTGHFRTPSMAFMGVSRLEPYARPR